MLIWPDQKSVLLLAFQVKNIYKVSGITKKFTCASALYCYSEYSIYSTCQMHSWIQATLKYIK